MVYVKYMYLTHVCRCQATIFFATKLLLYSSITIACVSGTQISDELGLFQMKWFSLSSVINLYIIISAPGAVHSHTASLWSNFSLLSWIITLLHLQILSMVSHVNHFSALSIYLHHVHWWPYVSKMGTFPEVKKNGPVFTFLTMQCVFKYDK